MPGALTKNPRVLPAVPSLPHLSHSRIDRYLTCPEQYRLYYLEGLRPRFPSASLVFGQIVHQALAHLFQERGDPIRFFLESWKGTKDLELDYARHDSWEKLRDSGEALLRKFQEEELPKVEAVEATERAFKLDVTGLEAPFIGFIDLVARIQGERTVVDFKTSGKKYQGHEATMSDQLTAYQLAEPEASQLALWVLVRTKEPRIEWHPTKRSPEDLVAYLAKADFAARQIQSGRFFKNPGLHCSWCDYLPICSGNLQKAEETLVRPT